MYIYNRRRASEKARMLEPRVVGAYKKGTSDSRKANCELRARRHKFLLRESRAFLFSLKRVLRLSIRVNSDGAKNV